MGMRVYFIVVGDWVFVAMVNNVCFFTVEVNTYCDIAQRHPALYRTRRRFLCVLRLYLSPVYFSPFGEDCDISNHEGHMTYTISGINLLSITDRKNNPQPSCWTCFSMGYPYPSICIYNTEQLLWGKIPLSVGWSRAWRFFSFEEPCPVVQSMDTSLAFRCNLQLKFRHGSI